MVQKTTLTNGIRLVTERIPSVHSVAMGIWVNVGSRDERGPERGITHFIEHMLFKGTQRRSALHIAKELDAVGGFANAFTSKENVCVHAKVLHTHLPLVVDVLTDIFLHSTFAPDEMERERQVILQEISMIEDSPEDLVHILFQQEFWKDHPLANPIYGTPGTVRALDREKALDYMTRRFRPPRIVVAAAGLVEHQAFVELLGPTLSDLPGSESAAQRRPPALHPHRQVVAKDLEQVHLCLGFPGCSHSDPDRFASHVLNVVLGNSMSSRLFQEVREKRGLAYSVYSFANSHEDTGLMGIYAAVAPSQVEETARVIQDQMARLVVESITEEELSAAKEYLKGSMYLNAESTDSRMNRLAKNEIVFGRWVSFQEVEEQIDNVTTEDVRRWLQSVYRPESTAVTLLGPVTQEVLHRCFPAPPLEAVAQSS
ncbi:Predicted Zn-dependent peptidase [Desulfacinum hydrothermale DSM 13146]|uniref:Predicted Zn-dependent peptidase n=1 Tax=Desulfacinum hydrothermale DSM 13146 TaxID=1121390 RepID=A0A1W1X8W6_9BACT|nr:pitrilysin family protein [Desulfacinum hydrothermale]SMC20412.1 Predicted Zn-dependent peptidase [Desulfacinum hydrothermale DSM 13146]